MKKLAFILGIIAYSSSVVAQVESNVKQSDLKGPAYKNYQIWTDKSEPVKIYSQINIKQLEGPAYKSQQAVMNTPKENLAVVTTAGDKRQKLTGPAYKNYGPWTK
jgi:hypothetical protein